MAALQCKEWDAYPTYHWVRLALCGRFDWRSGERYPRRGRRVGPDCQGAWRRAPPTLIIGRTSVPLLPFHSWRRWGGSVCANESRIALVAAGRRKRQVPVMDG